jgi:hypothetical protein
MPTKIENLYDLRKTVCNSLNYVKADDYSAMTPLEKMIAREIPQSLNDVLLKLEVLGEDYIGMTKPEKFTSEEEFTFHTCCAYLRTIVKENARNTAATVNLAVA